MRDEIPVLMCDLDHLCCATQDGKLTFGRQVELLARDLNILPHISGCVGVVIVVMNVSVVREYLSCHCIVTRDKLRLRWRHGSMT